MEPKTIDEMRAEVSDEVAGHLAFMLTVPRVIRPEWLPIIRAKLAELRAESARLRPVTTTNDHNERERPLATTRA